jgi:hypothetical protein
LPIERRQGYAGGKSFSAIQPFGAVDRAAQIAVPFVAWVAAPTNTPAEVIAIDGKTSRRSYQKKGSKGRSISSLPSRHCSI